MKKFLVAVLAVLFAAIPVHRAQSSEMECLKETPLPAHEVSPITEAVGNAADFLGVWGGGRWGNVLCHTLVVTKVIKNGDAAKASILYSWGKGYNFIPGYNDLTGEIRNGKLSFTLSQGKVKVEYVIASDGTLRGTYERSRVGREVAINTVTLSKIPK